LNVLEKIQAAWGLARLKGCASPESQDSTGDCLRMVVWGKINPVMVNKGEVQTSALLMAQAVR